MNYNYHFKAEKYSSTFINITLWNDNSTIYYKLSFIVNDNKAPCIAIYRDYNMRISIRGYRIKVLTAYDKSLDIRKKTDDALKAIYEDIQSI